MKTLNTQSLKQSGVSLVELSISLLIASFIFISLAVMASNLAYSSKKQVAMIELDQELSTLAEQIAKDVKRAGYWAKAGETLNSGNNNPFMAAATDLQVVNNNCVLFSYDRNKNGLLSTVNTAGDDERYGYRLVNKAIQYRPASANYSCNAANDTWANMNNTDTLIVTGFTVSKTDIPVNSITYNDGATLNKRFVTITITAQLTDYPTVTKTISKQVLVRNDRFN